MKRNRRGKSLIEATVSTALLGLVAVASISLTMFFSQAAKETAIARHSIESLNQAEETLSPTVSNMVFRKYLPTTFESNGPVNDVFSKGSTTSARWHWKNNEPVMWQLYPHIYGVAKKSGICLQDRETRVEFDRSRQILLLDYQYRGDGELVECLGGKTQGMITVKDVVVNHVSEAQVVRVGNRALRLWFKQYGEWRSVRAGFLEQ
ncbi:MAG: hypothetical protein KME03_07550 [Aphanocapsa lilacina HA4352-LM1]|jgi:type II secretory pathway component PulJ|nr:hypothetical protein [Aphanocapsa lilacina HA4352-LM1]